MALETDDVAGAVAVAVAVGADMFRFGEGSSFFRTQVRPSCLHTILTCVVEAFRGARPSLRHAIDATDAIRDEVETKQNGLKRWLALL